MDKLDPNRTVITGHAGTTQGRVITVRRTAHHVHVLDEAVSSPHAALILNTDQATALAEALLKAVER